MKKILKNLADQGWLKRENGIGHDQIKKRLDRALIDLESAKHLLGSDEIGAYRMAYDSMLQAGLSLILFHGFRPKVKNFHKTVVACNKLILGDEYYALTRQFDQMRKNRHDTIYDLAPISSSETHESIKAAENFIRKIIRYIKQNSPQKELF